MADKKNITTRDHGGKKIDDNPLVFQVVNLMYKDFSDNKIVNILKGKYGFSVSAPSVASFRKNYYPERLKHLLHESKKFKADQKKKMQTFIDDSQEMCIEIKESMATLKKDIVIIRRRLEFVKKFEHIVTGTFGKYIDEYDPNNPQTFMAVSPQKMLDYENIKVALGQDYDILKAFINKHDSVSLSKSLSALENKLLDQRTALIKIQQDIFKSYKALSMVQELTVIFEKYNGIIVEEFFPNRGEIDQKKYKVVRHKILSLFDELMVRYQGIDPVLKKGEPIDAEFTDITEAADAATDIPEPESLFNNFPNPDGNTPERDIADIASGVIPKKTNENT